MNNNPLVSILSPCYNVEKYLPKCLDTIIGQTYSNLQIVLIDDGSKDGTWEIMQEYAFKDSRIEVYHQDNKGVATTRNNLLDKVKGDFVLFVDSDDWVELTMVESLLGIQKQSDADIVVCDMVKNDNTPNLSDRSYTSYNQKQIVKAFLEHTWLNGSLWNKLVKTSLLHNERFRCGISYGEDALFCWHLLQHVTHVAVCKLQLYHYRMNEASLSHQVWTPEKKGSSTIVWRTITSETQKWYPYYVDTARSRWAIEDFWGLYYASLSCYPYDKHIKERQINIKRNLRLIVKSNLVSKNKLFTALVLAYCYPLGRFLKYMRK